MHDGRPHVGHTNYKHGSKVFENNVNRVVRLNVAPANWICFFRAMAVPHAHVTWANVDLPMRDGKIRRIDGDYDHKDVYYDVED